MLQNSHEVHLFEKELKIGGHTYTVVLEQGPDAGIGIDMGFIVCNNWNYPNLHKFFNQLQVEVRDTNMSFGYYCENSNFQYSFDSLASFLLAGNNGIKPSYWKFMLELISFNSRALKSIEIPESVKGLSLGEFLKKLNISSSLIDHYIVPMGASIWSTSQAEMMTFPAESFLSFFKNHGLFNLYQRPQWQTVVGGSHSYLKKFTTNFKGTIHNSSQISHVERNEKGVRIHFKNGQAEPMDFDKVIFSLHADQVLSLLENPTEEERKNFGVWEYQKNSVVLHSDSQVMPEGKRSWASWNFYREKSKEGKNPVTMTYQMNQLQGFKAKNQYFVTLNQPGKIKEDKIIREVHFNHPTFTVESLKAREEIKNLNGKNNSYFCGSYFGFGFHEDGIKSSVDLATKYFGVDW